MKRHHFLSAAFCATMLIAVPAMGCECHTGVNGRVTCYGCGASGSRDPDTKSSTPRGPHCGFLGLGRCSTGTLCADGNTCLSLDSARVCSDETTYCGPDHKCTQDKKCIPAGSAECGKGYCTEGSFCAHDNECVSLNSIRVCSDGSYCGQNSLCTTDRQCVSLTSSRVCSDGKSYCGEGSLCTKDKKCLSLASARVCSDTKHYCEEGTLCTVGNQCLARTSARVCSDGEHYCGEGSRCAENNQCFAVSQAQPLGIDFTGTWSDREKGVVSDLLRGFKDESLRDWIEAQAEANRFKANNFGSISVNGSTLRFRDGFFQEKPARRENLLAFEAGKAFWNSNKDRQLGDGKTLESWFFAYSAVHGSVITDMKVAKNQGGDDLSTLGDFDAVSQFAYMFRAQALQLARPAAARSSQKEWESVSKEFRARIAPLSRGQLGE
jgi:hypothetical protein